MKKIIIISITALMKLAGAGDLQGREPHLAGSSIRFLEKDVPVFNISPGVHLGVSTNIWRFSPFFRAEQRASVFGESSKFQRNYYRNYLRDDQTIESFLYIQSTIQHSRNPMGLLRWQFSAGTDFRMTDRTSIRLAYSAFMGIEAGILFEPRLSNRTNLQLGASFGRGNLMIKDIHFDHRIYHSPERYGQHGIIEREGSGWGKYDNRANQIKTGAKLRFNLGRNFTLEAGVDFRHKFGVQKNFGIEDSYRGEPIATAMIPETRNLLGATVGLHYNIPLNFRRIPSFEREEFMPRQQQPSVRTPRPTHRAIQPATCPNMRQRPHDRPPTIFNHPTRR